MTISTTASRISYTGNGSTDEFSFPYPVLATTDLVVIETIITTGVETVQVITTDYTVALVGGGTSATVTAVTPPASTVTWTIYRDPAQTQGTDFTDNDPLPAASIEDALDRLTMIEQRSRSLVDRSLKQPEGDTADIDYLPAKVDRASKYMAFDADGDPIATTGTGTVSSVSSAMIEDDAVTLAKMAGGTDGNLITYDAAGDPAYVATGTATHVLTSNGAGAAPTFQAFTIGAGTIDTAELADDAVTLAKMAAGTDGELITWDAAGDPAVVAVGTSGHVLTSNGVGAAPTFQAASAAGMVLISTTDISGSPSTVDLTGFASGTYDAYRIVFGGIRGATNAQLLMRTSTDGGSTFDSGSNNYSWMTSGTHYTGGTATAILGDGGTGDTSISLTTIDVGNTGNEGASGTIDILFPHLALPCRIKSAVSAGNSLSGNPFVEMCGGYRDTSADVDAVRLYWDSGNFANQGTINFYGIRNA